MKRNKRKATAVAAALASALKRVAAAGPAATAMPATATYRPTRMKLDPNESIKAMACPIKECEWSSRLAKKADCGSYNIAGYERHLREAHDIFLPRPIPVIEVRN